MDKAVSLRSILLQEIESLPQCFYGEVIDFVGYIKEKKAKEYLVFEKAAEAAAEEYRINNELTAFCSLDSESFYETR